MIPLVLGWVYIGNQKSTDSIKAILNDTDIPILSHERNLKRICIGIKDRTAFDGSSTPPRPLEHDALFNPLPQTFLGFFLAGDDLEPGPMFNYARVWTHMNASKQVAEAFLKLARRQKQLETVNSYKWEEKN